MNETSYADDTEINIGKSVSRLKRTLIPYEIEIADYRLQTKFVDSESNKKIIPSEVVKRTLPNGEVAQLLFRVEIHRDGSLVAFVNNASEESHCICYRLAATLGDDLLSSTKPACFTMQPAGVRQCVLVSREVAASKILANETNDTVRVAFEATVITESPIERTSLTRNVSKLSLGDALAKDLGNIRTRDVDSCDMTIVCQDKEFRVHKLVLRARSVVFERMLASGMVEADTGRIEIIDSDSVTVDVFINYLYGGPMPQEMSFEDVSSLLLIAEKYNTTQLIEYCSSEVMKMMDESNCLRVAQLGHLCNRKELIAAATNHIINKEKSLDSLSGQEILKQYPDLMYEITTRLMQEVARDKTSMKKKNPRKNGAESLRMLRPSPQAHAANHPHPHVGVQAHHHPHGGLHAHYAHVAQAYKQKLGQAQIRVFAHGPAPHAQGNPHVNQAQVPAAAPQNAAAPNPANGVQANQGAANN